MVAGGSPFHAEKEQIRGYLSADSLVGGQEEGRQDPEGEAGCIDYNGEKWKWTAKNRQKNRYLKFDPDGVHVGRDIGISWTKTSSTKNASWMW